MIKIIKKCLSVLGHLLDYREMGRYEFNDIAYVIISDEIRDVGVFLHIHLTDI